MQECQTEIETHKWLTDTTSLINKANVVKVFNGVDGNYLVFTTCNVIPWDAVALWPDPYVCCCCGLDDDEDEEDACSWVSSDDDPGGESNNPPAPLI